MSIRIIPSAATAAALTLAAVVAYPAAAAPASGGIAGLTALAQADVVQVAKKKKYKNNGHYRNGAYRRSYRDVDTVGTLGYDGIGYGYNRFSGQRYWSCMTDDGYGRARPCDAGGGGGGGGRN